MSDTVAFLDYQTPFGGLILESRQTAEEVAMPLSEYEQRVLDDLERDLGADPKLKSAMTRSRRTAGRLVTATLGVVVGLGVVLAGVMTKVWLLGIGGFALMITIVLWALLGPTASARGAKGAAKGPTKGPAKGRQGFMARLEERFERRRERGDV
jgi:hypothetical protein